MDHGNRITALETERLAVGRTLDRLAKELTEFRVEFRTEFDRLDKRLDEQYVTQKEFWPVKAIVFSGAGIILTAVLTAIIGVVVIQFA